MTTHSAGWWAGFGLFLIIFILLDLRKKEMTLKRALISSVVSIALALAFNVLIYFSAGPTSALEFLTGYLVEKSLSVDNLFVFSLIFTFFNVSIQNQSKILHWGILTALILRLIFILAGVAVVERFHGVIYLLGAFLVYSGFKLFFQGERKIIPEKNFFVRILKSNFPLTEEEGGGRFFIRKNAKVYATPLLIVLILIESSDVIFAMDSIPAIFAITEDPFIIYTSNAFAILGLRSLYFVLANLMDKFTLLKSGLSLILIFIGLKMVAQAFYTIPLGIVLGVVVLILASCMLLSLFYPRHQ